MRALPREIAREAARRLREAAEMGDVGALAEIASDLASRAREFAPYESRIARLADDFDLDGVLALAGELEDAERECVDATRRMTIERRQRVPPEESTR